MPVQKIPEPKAPAPKSDRRPWKKKTPVEIFFEQAEKLKTEINESERALESKRRQFQQFEQARKIFDGQ